MKQSIDLKGYIKLSVAVVPGLLSALWWLAVPGPESFGGLATGLAVSFYLIYRLLRQREEPGDNLDDGQRPSPTIDLVTQLPNNDIFQKDLRHSLTYALTHNLPLALIRVDVDSFQTFNRAVGLEAGDMVLARIAFVLQEVINTGSRITDLRQAYRCDSDEFALLLSNCGYDEATQIMEELKRRWVNERFQGDEAQPSGRITLSLGLATAPVDARKPEMLIRKARQRIALAKLRSYRKFPVGEKLNGKKSWHSADGGRQSELEMILLSVLEAKDLAIYYHCQRVAFYSAAIGEQLGLPVERVHRLKLAGMFHDIGMLEVPNLILQKQGSLEPNERQRIEEHPFLGGRIASLLPKVKEVIESIQYHQERMDGSGYPVGLSGNDIPLDARIIAVADSFDAMTSRRYYRTPVPVEQALADLNERAGREYDPDAVLALRQLVNENPEIRKALLRETGEEPM